MGVGMRELGILDWALVFGVALFGSFLSIYLKAKYKVEKRDFIMVSLFVAALAAVLIGAYHLLRGMLALSP